MSEVTKIRSEQLAVLLEIEAAVKHAKAAWLRQDQSAIADALDRAAEASARMPKDPPTSEYAVAT
jgi:hypothetical protein